MEAHTVLSLVADLLPPNVVAVSLRRVNRACRAQFSASTKVDCTAWLPLWAVQEGAAQVARRSKRRNRQENMRRFWHAVVQSGELSNLQLLAAEGGAAWSWEVYVRAASAGHVHVLQWALRSGCPLIAPHPYLTNTTCKDMVKQHSTREAAKHGHIPVLQWLAQEGYLNASDVWYGAAMGKQTCVLQWADLTGIHWRHNSTAATAAEHGHLAVLQWLQRQACPWGANVCEGAARGGQLGILKWLRAGGCPWDKRVCQAAAAGGHLEVLQWARSQQPPCPWDSSVTHSAVQSDRRQVVQWALANGCPYEKEVYPYVRRHKLAVGLRGFWRYRLRCNIKQLGSLVLKAMHIAAVAEPFWVPCNRMPTAFMLSCAWQLWRLARNRFKAGFESEMQEIANLNIGIAVWALVHALYIATHAYGDCAIVLDCQE